MTMKPCIISRLTTIRPGTPRGPGSGVAVSYWDTAPQQAMRPCRAMLNKAASSTAPPTLSK